MTACVNVLEMCSQCEIVASVNLKMNLFSV